MRPVRLAIQGLRSYRQHQEIDWTATGDPPDSGRRSAGLVAILGDTGAGKSSILEALCVALYAAPTWDKKNVKALISSGAPSLDVELEFDADGKRWRVTRSLPAGSYPPATHQLIGLDDGSRVDGAKEVNARIQQLVGLDYDAFLRAVLLPQGRFQALLQATGGDRTSILKGIFRLDLLERVRSDAGARLELLEPRLQKLQARRSVLLPDPEGAAAAAERRRDDAGRECAALDATLAEVGVLTTRREEARRKAAVLETAAHDVRGFDLAAEVEQLAKLVARDRELEASDNALASTLAGVLAEQKELAARIARATEAGLGLEAVVGASRTLSDLIAWLAAAAQAGARLDAAGEDLARRAVALQSALQELGALAAKVAAARSEVERARAERDEARRVVDDARQRWTGAQEARRRLGEREQAVERSTGDLARARKALTAAQRDARAAAEALVAAEALLAESHRRHAAAHAAAGKTAGDPCPVCDRKLPAAWRAPAAPDAEAAASACEVARRRDATSRAQHSTLEERASNLASRLAEETEAKRRAEHELAEKIALVRQLAGEGATLEQTEQTALAPLARRLAALDERLTIAERLWTEHDTRCAERQRALHTQQAESIVEQKQLDAERARLAQERHDWSRRAAALSEPLRPTETDAGAADAALRRAEQELAAARDRQARIESLTREAAKLQRSLSEVTESRNAEVLRPARAVARRLGDLWHHLGILARELAAETPPRSDGESVAEAMAWAGELAAARDGLLQRFGKTSKELARVLIGAEKSIRAALSKAGVESDVALAERRTDAQVRLRLAADELATARAQIDEVRDLDRRLADAAPFLAELRDLHALLTDGRFVGYVVEKKQRSLLAVASKLLGEMTSERYAFSEDFDVLDRLSGEPRSVKTLSGGETFLASLALALGLVELAGREGGRLDSLFLDEGFGSLDANALAEALDALQEQAAQGRMVAVISHLRAVAENIDRVLFVTRTPGGSRAEWLSEAQRASLVEEDASAGLLS